MCIQPLRQFRGRSPCPIGHWTPFPRAHPLPAGPSSPGFPRGNCGGRAHWLPPPFLSRACCGGFPSFTSASEAPARLSPPSGGAGAPHSGGALAPGGPSLRIVPPPSQKPGDYVPQGNPVVRGNVSTIHLIDALRATPAKAARFVPARSAPTASSPRPIGTSFSSSMGTQKPWKCGTTASSGTAGGTRQSSPILTG